MKNNIHTWSFRKHVLFSLVISVLVHLAKQLLSLKSAASIGIIGGADGPTAIFVSGIDGPTAVFVAAKLLSDFIGILLFVVLLVLYKPIRFLIEKL